ncbi:microfibril-associated glycoprotein 4-like [Apostichopus japonicus]|uniref:microfibril-associated glycoprotein 4-like n=1 Tax=Stichopus japonicus TaxID=307972 RepID=UPI003AB2E5DA
MNETKYFRILLIMMILCDVGQAGRLCEFAEKFPGVGGSCYKGSTNDDTTKLSTTSPPVDTSSQSIDTTRLSTQTVCLPGQLRCYNDDNEEVCAAPENCTCQMTSVNAKISAGGFYVNPDCTRMAHCINGNVTWDDEYSCSPNAQCEKQGNVHQCYCKAGYNGDGKTCLQLTNCQDVYTAGINESGIYTIKPTGWPGSPFPVYCNMADGGGWTVFQRRVNGSVDFYRNWTSYKEGFGQIVHEFWMGNDKLYYITNQDNYQIRIDLVDREGTPYFAEYDLFRINDENDKYRLSAVGTHSGTAEVLNTVHNENALKYQFNSSFSTYDQDNDKAATVHCTVNKQGAWWHSNCCRSNLNGNYFASVIPSTKSCCGSHSSICWNKLPGPDHNIKYTEMKIRPVRD